MGAALSIDECTNLPQGLISLIEDLSSQEGAKSLTHLQKVLTVLELTREDLAPWLKFGEECYRRNLLFQNADFEVLALTWRSGQWSPIHNHRGSFCAVRVIEGIASEISFSRSAQGTLYPVHTEHFQAGDVCVSSDEDIHQIANLQAEGQGLVSLHVYSPPLKGMDLFPLSQSTFGAYDQLLIQSTRRYV